MEPAALLFFRQIRSVLSTLSLLRIFWGECRALGLNVQRFCFEQGSTFTKHFISKQVVYRPHMENFRLLRCWRAKTL